MAGMKGNEMHSKALRTSKIKNEIRLMDHSDHSVYAIMEIEERRQT